MKQKISTRSFIFKNTKNIFVFVLAKYKYLSAKILILLFCNMITACSSPTARQQIEAKQAMGRPRAAAYAADGFTLDYRSPEPRPYRSWEFYYKHCNLVSRNPFPTQDEYSCTGPF